MVKKIKEAKVVEAPKTSGAQIRNGGVITWEAEEYIVRDKSSWWYVGLVAIALILIAISVWMDWGSFIIVIVLSVIALLLYTLRPPRKIRYTLDKRGISEGDQLHEYMEFRSFGLMDEEGHYAIVLTPHKRFSPRMTVYFPETQGEEIVDAFGMRLPMEEVKMDALDKLIKFLRI